MVAEGGEGENPLPFSLTAPKRGGGWGRGGVGGGVGGVSRLRFPPGPHLRSSRFSRHPRLRQAPTRRFAKKSVWWFLWGKGPKPLVGRAPSPWGPRPQAPWRPGPQAPEAWIPPRSPGSASQVFNFLLRLKPIGSGSQNATITPSPLTFGGPWMVSEGGAVQFHERRGSIFAPAFQPLGRAPSP